MRWPQGIRSATLSCGIKKSGRPDLGVIYSPEPMRWAGVFTQNAAAAAPVEWCRSLLGTPAKVLVVNSGNANACTGAEGKAAVKATVEAAAGVFSVDPGEVLVASTGPIGVPLPVDRIVEALPAAATALGAETAPFFDAIRTTDTKPKLADSGRVTGVAKGAAMVAPNMATMLAFLATDAPGPSEGLQKVLQDAVDRSFNRISVDGCESTNDSVFLFSTGRGPEMARGTLEAEVSEVCSDLAVKIVGDSEGGTKVVEIAIRGANDEEHAATLGRAVASSDLFRAALHGCDPNWGRVVSALGSADRSLDLETVSVSIAGVELFGSAGPIGDAAAAKEAMEAERFQVSCSVGEGPGRASIFTCDLSPGYVKLNAFGMT